MIREHWTTPRFIARVTVSLLVGLLLTSAAVWAQTTYHLHQEVGTSGSARYQLLSTGADAPSVSFLSEPMVVPGDYFIADFETIAGVPNANGYIPANTTLQLSLWMRKTSAAGLVYPKAGVYLNSQSGTLLCGGNGTTPLTQNVTQVNFICNTAVAVDMGTSDRFYLWVGASEFGEGVASLKAELDIEGTASPIYDSTVAITLPTPAPSIASIGTAQAPGVAQAAIGGTVIISGSHFGTSQGTSVVTFNGISAGLCSPTPSCWSDSIISINVPAGATSGNVVVNVNGVNSNGVNLTVVPPPVITSVAPMWIPVGGAMTITGSGFGPSGTVTIKGGDGSIATAAIASWSGTAINVTVPSSITPGTSTQAMVSANGFAGQPFIFTTHRAPSLSTLDGPAICLVNGVNLDLACVTQGAVGAQVYIRGSDFGQFQGDSTVTFGGIQAAEIEQGGSRFITATIPSGITPLPQAVNVVVTVDGVSSSIGPSFTVTAPPAISSLSVPSGSEGTQVTINGSSFGSTGIVTFNGTAATVQSGNWGASQIVTTVPTGASSGPVVVMANGVPSNGINFNVPPSIVSPLSPNNGPVGTVVVISGAGFGSPQGSSTVTFNGTAAIVKSWGANSITALVPSLAPGTVTVNVTVAGQSATASFTVTAGPSITSLSSTSGATGSLVGINGSGFGSLQGSSIVRFNGAAAQVCTTNCGASSCVANGWSNSCIPVYVPGNATTGPVSVTVATQTATGPQFTVTGSGAGQISGTVTCSSGTVMVQALRRDAVQGSTTTSCNASYSITNLAADSYDVRASATGLGTATQNAVPVTVGGNTSGINFALSTAATITGQITNVNGGAAINNVTVQIFVGSALVASVNTGTGNTYTINNLNAATYLVQAAASGFIAQSKSVTVTAGATVTQNFALQAPGNTPITYSYDNLGRLIGVTDQSGDTATYNYDAVGNITSIGRRSSSQLSLISIAPQAAHVGDAVTLTGTGFSSTASQNTIQFTGGSAVASSASATQVTTSVPVGASTGSVAVNVNGTVSNSILFTVLTGAATPTIANLNPAIGVSGTSFTVTGTNFDPVIGNDQLGLNGTNLLIDASTYTSTNIGTSVPASATSGHVSLTTSGGTAVSSQDFFVVPPGHVTSDIAYTARTPFPSSGAVPIGTIPANQIAMVLFDAVGGQKTNIQVNSTSFTACELQVWAPNSGATPIYDRLAPPNCATAGFSTGGITLPTTGTYTVVFYNLGSNTATLSFTLLNATDFASPITFGQTLTIPLTTVGQTGRLTFLAQPNQHISVDVVAGLGSTCNLSLLGPANQSLQFADVSGPLHFTSTGNCSTTNNFWDIGYLPSLAGIYTIVIDPQGATGSVQLQLLDSTDTTTTPISLTTSGSTVPVSNAVPGQNNRVVFSGTAGQKFAILINSMSGYAVNSQGVNVYLQMIGPDGTWLTNLLSSTPIYAGRFFDPRSANQVLPATGNYTILVDPAGFNTSPGSDPKGAATGSVSLTLYLVADVTAPTLDGTALSPGASSTSPSVPTVSQQVPGQKITFPFRANIGQNLSIQVADQNNSGCSFTIFDPNNQVLPSTSSLYQNVACSAVTFRGLTDPLPATGTYTLVLQPGIGGSAPYNTGSFQVTLTNTQDNFYTISPTSTGSELTVSTTIPGQNDVITFQGTAGQVVSLYFNATNYTGNGINASMIGPAGQVVIPPTGITAGQTFTTNPPLPATGTYWILIGSATTMSTGSTTFTLKAQ